MYEISNKEVRCLALVTVLVALAFTIADLSFFFFLQCLFASASAFLVHKFSKELASTLEGLSTECHIWTNGLILTVFSGIVSMGQAVLIVPIYSSLSSKETSRWKRSVHELTSRDIGVVPAAGIIGNLGMAVIFLFLLNMSNLQLFYLGAKINLWMSFSMLMPLPNLDGVDIMQWRELLWLLLTITSVIGLIGIHIV